MKLGFVDAILATYSFEEVLEFASDHKFQLVEMCAWPVRSPSEAVEIRKNAELRGMQESLINIFLGITHIDVANLDEAKIAQIKAYQENECTDFIRMFL